MYKNITPDEERQLIQAAQREPEGIRALYHAYHPRIFAYVGQRVGRKQDAEDIVSDIFIRMVKSLMQFEYRGTGSFSAWLFQIARNEVRRFYGRSEKNQPMFNVDDVPTISSDALPPDLQVQRKEQFLELRAAMNRLSTRRKEIIELRFFGGLRNIEIAEILDLDERTIASHLSRGIEDLRQIYTNRINAKGNQHVNKS